MPATIDTNSRSIGELGREIYERDLAPVLETEENIGKALVIDVDSGDYVVADDKLQASKELQTRRAPGRFYFMLIGYDAGGTMGGILHRIVRS